MDVKVYFESHIAHTNQVYTGLSLLHDKGIINLEIIKADSLKASDPFIRLEINNKKITIDLADSSFFLNTDLFNKSDIYFKRMLTNADRVNFSDKLFPFGLNYPVYYKADNLLKRGFLSKDIKYFVSALARSNNLISKAFKINNSYNNSSIQNFEDLPKINNNLKIIFFTRLWSPDNVKDPVKKEHRIKMNDHRISLVSKLKKEFKNNYIGGIQEGDYANKVCKDICVSMDNAHKHQYLNNLRNSHIGIADAGLEDSVGFKMAEYVSMAKAIISQPFDCVLPGDFIRDSNYFSYSSIEECLQHCDKLLASPESVLEMMYKNYYYYQKSLRPDILMLNIIYKVLNYPIPC